MQTQHFIGLKRAKKKPPPNTLPGGKRGIGTCPASMQHDKAARFCGWDGGSCPPASRRTGVSPGGNPDRPRGEQDQQGGTGISGTSPNGTGASKEEPGRAPGGVGPAGPARRNRDEPWGGPGPTPGGPGPARGNRNEPKWDRDQPEGTGMSPGETGTSQGRPGPAPGGTNSWSPFPTPPPGIPPPSPWVPLPGTHACAPEAARLHQGDSGPQFGRPSGPRQPPRSAAQHQQLVSGRRHLPAIGKAPPLRSAPGPPRPRPRSRSRSAPRSAPGPSPPG